jgi:hypothetical protein
MRNAFSSLLNVPLEEQLKKVDELMISSVSLLGLSRSHITDGAEGNEM